MKIGNDLVASWKDDKSASCSVSITFTGKDGTTKVVNSGDKLTEEGKLQLKVTDEAGNTSTAEITLTRTDTEAPKIEVLVQEKNVVAGVKVTVDGSQLLLDSTPAASWTDDYSTTFSIDLAYVPTEGQSKTINSGDILFDAGKLTISVADEFQNKSTAEFTLTSVAVYGLENLQSKTLQVDQEVDLLDGVTFAEGLILGKFEVEENGVRTEMANPNAYIPQSAGTINIIITLGRSDGSTIEVRVDGLTVKGIDYQAITLRDITPEEIFPQIAQIESGDKNIYSYVEDLRIAEAARIRDMMGVYGAGNYTPEQYQELMSRITMGLIYEAPEDYENYEWIGPVPESVYVSEHAKGTSQNLFSLKSKYTDIKLLSNLGEGWAYNLMEYAKNNPNRIILFSSSASPQYYTYPEYKEYVFSQTIIDLGNQPNVLVFFSGGDTKTIN